MENEVFPKLGNMKEIIPDWYKKADRMMDKEFNPEFLNFTVKACMPFLDTYLTGYYVPSPVDLWVKNENGDVEVKWRKDGSTPETIPPISVRGPNATPGMQTPSGYYEKHFTWITKFTIKSPKGYSLLITQPLNRMDLPTYTLSGIVDAENAMYGGNIPFFVKEGFSGLIPAGTPIMQIIPIKQDSWKIVENPEILKQGKLLEKLSTTKMGGFYKSKLWRKKQYK